MIGVAAGLLAVVPALQDDSLEERLASRDYTVKFAAVKEAGALDSLEAAKGLVGVACDPGTTFKRYLQMSLRDQAFLGLARLTDAEAVAWVASSGLGAAADAGPPALRAVLESLGRLEVAVPTADARRLLGKKWEPETWMALADLLGGKGEGEADARALARCKGAKSKDPLVRAAILEARAALDQPGTAADLARALGDRVAELRVTALRLQPGAAGAVEAVRLLGDSSVWVRMAAADRLVRVREADSVVPLMAALAAEPAGTRARAAIARALTAHAGLALGEDPADWARWWADQDSGFEVFTGDPPAHPPAVDGGTVAKWYGLRVADKGVVFVIDQSGSMLSSVGTATGRTKFDVAREQTLRALDALPPDASFGVVFFPAEPHAWQDGLKPATTRNRKAAAEWIGHQAAGPAGNLYGALLMALEMPGVDHVYLLSDGSPSAGELRYDTRILERVARITRHRPVAVSTVATGGSKWNKKFLVDLAELTGGSAVVADR
jgi:hypothetical protein